MTVGHLQYPETGRTPLTEAIGGVVFDDPYRWLEEDVPEVLEWQARQNELAESTIRGWPGYATLRDAVDRSIVNHQRVFAPRRCGDLWFRQVVPEGSERAVVVVSDEPCGGGRRLIDPNVLGEVELDWFVPSPLGGFVAYGISERGTELSRLHVVETATGEVLPDTSPYRRPTSVAWLRDESGFYYSGEEPGQELQWRIFLHRLGHPPPMRPEPLDLRHPVARAIVSDDARYAAVLVDHLQPRPHYIREDGGYWRPFLRDLSGMFLGAFVGDRYVAITDDEARRGRVVSIPVETALDRSTWEELVPESEAVLRSITKVGDVLVLGELLDTYANLRLVDPRDATTRPIALPGKGTIGQSVTGYGVTGVDLVARGSGDVTFVYATFSRAPSVHRYDLGSGELEELDAPEVVLGDVVTYDEFAVSVDGTRVPLHIVARDDVDITTPRPTLIYAYGGFNIAFLPTFLGPLAPFVNAGGVVVHAHLRGGGEYGAEWWHQGRMHRKQNTFDDLYAVAQHLVDRGVSDAEHLAVMGMSNGGVLAGVAATQRPDLFRAVVARVPLLDFHRIGRDSYALKACLVEYGDPSDPEDAAVLHRYSPYHNVRDGVAYPAVLVDCGADDTRCPAWHGRKMVARLQAATSSTAPVLLRVRDAVGHLPAAARSAQVDAEAEWLGFVMSQLGLDPAG